MKKIFKNSKYISTLLLTLIVGVIFVAPIGLHVAHADGGIISNFFGVGDLNTFFQKILAYIAYFFLKITGWLVGISGLFLNSAINYGILYMKTEVDHISIINTAWKLIRDVGNMAFIFILLYIAIATILELEGLDTKRAIRNVIIIALLVNFSLFFTKVLIDASNIVTVSFYNQIVQNNGTILGFSESFARPLGISQFYDASKFVNDIATGSDQAFTNIAIIGIAGSIFLFFVALSFLYAAFLIMIRFVVLIFLMILSPLAYFLAILPSTQGYAKKWWTTLTNQLIFAPVYMLLIYIIMLLNNSFSLITGGNSVIPNNGSLMDSLTVNASRIAQAGTTGSTPLDSLLRFIIMLVFLNLAAVVATTAASNSGGFVSGIVTRTRTAAMGGLKYFGRGTANVAGQAAGATAKATGRGASNLLNTGYLTSQGAARKLDKDGERLRREAINPDRTVAGRAYRRQYINALEKQAAPHQDKVKEGVEDIKKNQVDKFGGATQDTQDRLKKSKDALGTARDNYLKVSADPEASLEAKENAAKTMRSAQRKVDQYERRKQREIKEQKMRLTLARTKKTKSGLLNFALNETTARNEKWKKASQEFTKAVKPPSESEAAKIRAEEAEDNITEAIERAEAGDSTAFETARKIVSGLSPKEVKNLPSEILTHKEIAPALDAEDLEQIKKSGNLSKEDRKKLGENVKTHFDKILEKYVGRDESSMSKEEKDEMNQANRLSNHLNKNKDHYNV